MSVRNVRLYQAVFLDAYGGPPWNCEGCGEVVDAFGRERGKGNVHHRDHDYTNNDAENLAILHHECHAALHELDEEARRKISATLKGRVSPTKGMTFSAETRLKMSQATTGVRNPFYGRTHTPDARRKMSRPRPRALCDACGREFAVNWLQRHRDEGRCHA